MTPESHTLFDWNTLDEYSDLKRLKMVFTSLSAGGLPDALCHMRSGGGAKGLAAGVHAQGLKFEVRITSRTTINLYLSFTTI